MFSSIEINFGIICACLPALRPLLSTMLPSFFASSQPFHHLHDEEQGKHSRYPTASSFTYIPGSAKRSYHSRTGSNTTRTHSPRYGHSRTASKGSSNESHAGTEMELGAIQKPQAGFTPSPHRIDESIPADALGIKGYPGLRFHPLRMSPANPSISSLPSLPERLANFSPMAPAYQSPHQSRSQRHTPRTPVHKPLPITPFPIMPGA